MRSLSWVTSSKYLFSVYLFSSCLFLSLSTSVTAETANLPASVKNFSVELPGRGMSKDKVRERFGYPIERIAAVGKPPISKWRYDLFTVYFESDYVIHAVVNGLE